MAGIYESLVRPVLFRFDAEKAHDLGLDALRVLAHSAVLRALVRGAPLGRGARPVELMGLRFPNAVGLAAGMDKNGEVWKACGALGFGFTEIGTVTARAQPGNERPRLFRYPRHGALVNRMGFNNEGAEAVAARLDRQGAANGREIPLGINIGKSRAADLDEAAADYHASFTLLAPYADYIAINVSSPNTPSLRDLQSPRYLGELLTVLQEANRAFAASAQRDPLPLLVKIAPDLPFRQIDEVLQQVTDHGAAGVIATNTTVERPRGLGIKESGGLSGRPLLRRSLEVVNYIGRVTRGKMVLIGVGGVDGPVDAGRLMDAGAHLVQTYTGFVYHGPFFARRLARALGARQRPWIG